MEPGSSVWLGLDGHGVIGLAPDGSYQWKADSHPTLRQDQITALARTRCGELERTLGEIDTRLTVTSRSMSDESLDELLDRRSMVAARLKILRGFLAWCGDVDLAA